MVSRGKVKHPEFRVFVEGGGYHQPRLRDGCREGFGKFFQRAGLGPRRPRIVVCGDRRAAFEDFCLALNQAGHNDVFILLVDSESFIAYTKSPEVWQHVKQRVGDGWKRPADATDEHLHFMVECMENWFLADPEALKRYYGSKLVENALPRNPDIESVSKSDVYAALSNATRNTTLKGSYSKGKHSFEILANLDPNKVAQKCPFACRVLEAVRKHSGADQLNCAPE